MPTIFDQEKANEELMKCPLLITHTLVTGTGHPNNAVKLDAIIDANRYGSKLKLLRVTAIVVKVTKLCQKNRGSRVKSGTFELTVQDLQLAEKLWIKSTQQQAFSNEYQILRHNKKEVFFKLLNLFLNKNGIARANWEMQIFHPMLMIQFC